MWWGRRSVQHAMADDCRCEGKGQGRASGVPVSEHALAKARFERIERATDLPMAALALLMVPALFLEERGATPVVRSIASGLNWIVWLAFCAEYVGKLRFAPS